MPIADPGRDRDCRRSVCWPTSTRSPPGAALTIKATGYQWYWGYTYPDNGGFDVISNMMPEEEAEGEGLPQPPRGRQAHGRAGRRRRSACR